MASEEAKVLFWRGLCCSTEAQDGEEVHDDDDDDDEEGRWGRSGGEAGGPVGFNFSIMVIKTQGKSLLVPNSRSSQLPSVFAVRVCHRVFLNVDFP